MRIFVVLLACGVVFGSCSPTDRSAAPRSEPAPSIETSPTPEHRGITNPIGVRIDNAAFGRSRAAVGRAMSDLKEVGLWRKLTKRLYIVKFGSRLGRLSVPDDGHLADAVLTAQIDGDLGGPRCDIMFFPTAMRDDLDRWETYHSQGLLPDEPPTWRQFWASIMAHELAHCLDGPNGEAVALRWEERALERLRAAGL